MKKNKFRQNWAGKVEVYNPKTDDYDLYYVNTTMGTVFVYRYGKLIGKAGVQNSRDFDFDTLFNLARKPITLKVA